MDKPIQAELSNSYHFDLFGLWRSSRSFLFFGHISPVKKPRHPLRWRGCYWLRSAVGVCNQSMCGLVAHFQRTFPNDLLAVAITGLCEIVRPDRAQFRERHVLRINTQHVIAHDMPRRNYLQGVEVAHIHVNRVHQLFIIGVHVTRTATGKGRYHGLVGGAEKHKLGVSAVGIARAKNGTLEVR